MLVDASEGRVEQVVAVPNLGQAQLLVRSVSSFRCVLREAKRRQALTPQRREM